MVRSLILFAATISILFASTYVGLNDDARDYVSPIYELQIQFDTPQGTITASGIFQEQLDSRITANGRQSFTEYLQGEAIGIDLPEIGRIFILMPRFWREGPQIYLAYACGIVSTADRTWLENLAEMDPDECEVDPSRIPPMIQFASDGELSSARVITFNQLVALSNGTVRLDAARIVASDSQPQYRWTEYFRSLFAAEGAKIPTLTFNGRSFYLRDDFLSSRALL